MAFVSLRSGGPGQNLVSVERANGKPGGKSHLGLSLGPQMGNEEKQAVKPD